MTPDELRARVAAIRAEAGRLDDLLTKLGDRRARLRVLTVICRLDHDLVNVYRVDGLLLWIGSRRVEHMGKWPDGTHGRRLRARRVRRRGLVDDDPTSSMKPFEAAGTCSCGTFSMSSEWLLEQMKREDMPARMRVVAPWAVRGYDKRTTQDERP